MIDDFESGYEYPQVVNRYGYGRTYAKPGFILPHHQLFPIPTCQTNNHDAYFSKIPESHRWNIDQKDKPIINPHTGRTEYTNKPWKYFIILPFNLPSFKQITSTKARDRIPNFPEPIMKFIYESSRVHHMDLMYKKEPHPRKQPKVYNFIDNETKIRHELEGSDLLQVGTRYTGEPLPEGDNDSRLWIHHYTTTPLDFMHIDTTPKFYRITLLEVSPYTWNHLGSQPIPIPSNIPEQFRDPAIFNALVSVLKPVDRFRFSRYKKRENPEIFISHNNL